MRTLPSNFEEQIFLHVNSSFWGVEEVKVAVNKFFTSDEEVIQIIK